MLAGPTPAELVAERTSRRGVEVARSNPAPPPPPSPPVHHAPEMPAGPVLAELHSQAEQQQQGRQQGARMLSRIAESMFWIGRYVERAEDTRGSSTCRPS